MTGPPQANPTRPTDTAPLSPSPLGRIVFTVSHVQWTQTDGATVVATVSADAQSFGAGSSGTLSLEARDTALDHVRVGDQFALTVDTRTG